MVAASKELCPFFGLARNVLVTAMLLSGCSTVVSDLTGMNTVATCLLLLSGVVVFTLFGGIYQGNILDRLCAYCRYHGFIMVFSFSAFATSDILGSPEVVWEAITKLTET